MKEQTRTSLNELLAAMDRHERQKLMKRAAQMRGLAQQQSKKALRRAYADVDEGGVEAPVKRTRSLEDYALDILRQEAGSDTGGAQAGALKGTVIASDRGACQVMVGVRRVECTLTPELTRVQQTAIAVGDEVTLNEHSGGGIVRSVLPRRTSLSRSDPDSQVERVVVANVDKVVLVVSVGSPPLHPRLIDRYLIAILRGGAQPVLVLNKIDLLTDVRELEKLEPYQGVRMPILHCSADTGEGLEELRRELRGSTCAFVGHSGVGKSSLLNALYPDLALATGGVSAGYGRGTHTTTRSSLHEIDGTRLIDTPGVRSFGFWNLTREELKGYFPEFAEVGRCRFSDCAHVAEPDCRVREAAERGLLSDARYETYLRLMGEL